MNQLVIKYSAIYLMENVEKVIQIVTIPIDNPC